MGPRGPGQPRRRGAERAAEAGPGGRELGDDDYAALLEFRTSLRQFLRWSEEQARAAGLTPAQHQLLVAVRGHRDRRGPTIGDLADYLLLRHHSAVGLVDRTEAAGLVQRRRDPDDARVVRVVLTGRGSARVEALSRLHLDELERLAPALEHLASRGDARLSTEDGLADEDGARKSGDDHGKRQVSRSDLQ